MVCQIEALRQCVRLPQLDAALKSLPKDLYETYERDLSGINDLVGDTFKILQWLAFSARPLQLKEVCEALAVDEVNGAYKFNPENRPQQPRDIFIICPNLISLETGPRYQGQGTLDDGTDDSKRLAHFSVKNYLTSKEIQSLKASRFSMKEPSAHPLIC